MPNRSSNKSNSRDINQIAKSIIDMATDRDTVTKAVAEGKNPAAVMLGRLGGLKGGRARADKLSAKERSRIAQKAAKTRWNR
jgi:hypothetical protein